MAYAFILINTEIGAEEEVLNTLKNMDEVVEAYIVYGVYDLICKIQAPTMDQLKEVVTTKLRGLDRVRSTMTMICVEKD